MSIIRRFETVAKRKGDIFTKITPPRDKEAQKQRKCKTFVTFGYGRRKRERIAKNQTAAKNG